MVWLGAPDQGASQGPVRPVGFERERDQPNILPLDLNFTFNFILSSLSVSSHIQPEPLAFCMIPLFAFPYEYGYFQ